MHLWIGRCISEWANIEETIFDICCIALCTHIKLAAIVFYKTPSLSARLTLTTELLQALFSKEPGAHANHILKNWREITATIDELILYRNLMAHQPLDDAPIGGYDFFINSDETDILKLMAYRDSFKIAMSKSEAIRGKKAKIPAIDEKDMPNYFERVRELYKSMISFRTSLQKEMLTAQQK